MKCVRRSKVDHSRQRRGRLLKVPLAYRARLKICAEPGTCAAVYDPVMSCRRVIAAALLLSSMIACGGAAAPTSPPPKRIDASNTIIGTRAEGTTKELLSKGENALLAQRWQEAVDAFEAVI